MRDPHLRPTQLPLEELAAAYVQAGTTLFLAIHDDLSARVRLAHPEAGYLEVAVDPDGDVELHGVWSAGDPDSDDCRLLYDPHDDAEPDWRDGPLDVEELNRDLSRVLSGSFLHHWGVVEPHPLPQYRDDRRWISLTPADRAAAIADIVRRHVPDAVSLICRFETRSLGIAVGFEQITRADGETLDIPCPHCSPDVEDGPWPCDVTYEIAHPLGQLYALPHLRRIHLTPCADLASEHEGQLWQLVLPYRAPAAAETTAH